MIEGHDGARHSLVLIGLKHALAAAGPSFSGSRDANSINLTLTHELVEFELSLS